MALNLDFFNPWSSRFYRSSDDLAALNAAEKSRNSWGVSDVFDQLDARLEAASRTQGLSQLTMTSLMVDQAFANKSHRIGWYRWMSDVPIIKKCLTIMANDCVSPNEKNQYACLSFTKNFRNMMHPYQIEQLQNEFEYICSVCLKADDRTLWDLFYQWLVDGEMFWEIVPGKKGDRVIAINVLNPNFTYPIYERGRIAGFCENLPLEYSEALGLPASEMNILKFKPYQVAYANYGKYGAVKQDIKGWLEPSVRCLNQLIQMEDSLLAVRVNRAIERLLVNVSTGLYGPQKAEQALNNAKHEYNKVLNYDSSSGRIVNRARTISLKEMFWFAVGSDGVKTTMESLTQNTTMNGQIEDVKIFEKKVYDALEIPETRRGGATDATYTNKHDLNLQEMQLARSARRLADRFAQNLIKKVFVQHLALRGYAPKYVNGDNYIVSMNRNNYYEKSRMFELNTTRGELMNSFSNYIRSGENKNPIISRKALLGDILQFSDEWMAMNDKMLKEEELDFPKEDEGGGDDVM